MIHHALRSSGRATQRFAQRHAFFRPSLAQLRLPPQQVMVVLGETMGLVAHVLQQPQGVAVPASSRSGSSASGVNTNSSRLASEITVVRRSTPQRGLERPPAPH